MGILHNEILRLRRHNSDSIYSRKYMDKQRVKDTANIIQLLAPACNALTNPCLTGPITTYDWAEGIPLMTIFVLFFVELMAMRYATFGHNHGDEKEPGDQPDSLQIHSRSSSNPQRHTPGEDHLGHTREHIEHEEHAIETSPNGLAGTIYSPHEVEDYAAQMTAIFILEFGVIFHSIFIGLTLAVAGPEFNVLYVVLAFHQTFEGLGLGSRLAATPWPKSKRWTPYLFALGYGMSTPLAIAVGLGVRKSYIPGSQTSLIVSGVFDSISAGILIYTGLVELMAHEFMFSNFMRRARLRIVLYAFGMMCLGAGECSSPIANSSFGELSANTYRSGLMACLGRWA
jgi:zinc transporter 1/2/3